MTNRGLRDSMISALIYCCHSDSSIILRTEHTSVDTLARYHNLQSIEGLRQQFGAFNSKFTTLPCTAAQFEALAKYNLQSKTCGKDLNVHSDHTAANCIAGAVLATNVQPKSTTPKNLVSKNIHDVNGVSTISLYAVMCA